MCSIYTLILFLILVQNQKGQDDKKFSVVLFFAKSSTTESYKQDLGIKYLNFEEKTRVKHCVPESGTDDDSLNSDCKQLLKSAIYALISFCRNVMGMTTAIASVDNDTFSNGLRFKKSSEDLEVRYHQPKQQSRSVNYITKPEHTEVFKIRSKRRRLRRQLEESTNVEDNSPVPGWDIFGVVANIKLTFFGKLFEKDKNQSPQFYQKAMSDQLGKVSQNNLFDLVKETLSNLQDSTDSGFLMIVLGGNLTDVCDIYSPLMQSVKHVIENVDEQKTLIVVTGSCPLIESANEKAEKPLIPVYVKGPYKTGSISILDQLYDVPYAIKNFLTDMNGGSYFTGIKTKRDKRYLFRPKTNQNRNRSVRLTLTSLLFFICLATLSLH